MNSVCPISGHICVHPGFSAFPPFDTLPYLPGVWCTCLYLSCFGSTFVSLLFLVHLCICPGLLCTSVHSHHPCVTLSCFWCRHTLSISHALLYLLHFSWTSPFAPFQDTSVFVPFLTHSVFVLWLEHFCVCPGSDVPLRSPHFSAFLSLSSFLTLSCYCPHTCPSSGAFFPFPWFQCTFVFVHFLTLFYVCLVSRALLYLSHFWCSSVSVLFPVNLSLHPTSGHFCLYPVYSALRSLSSFW